MVLWRRQTGRWLVPANQQRSFYEELRARNDDEIDVEDRAGLMLDEENLNHHFQDDEIDPETLAIESSRNTLAADARKRKPSSGRGQRAPAWPPHDDDDGDNDVPASLLVEHHDAEPLKKPDKSRRRPAPQNPTVVPGPSTRRNRAQWEATRNQQRLHNDDTLDGSLARGRGEPRALVNTLMGTARQKAEWRWANVDNLDSFMQDVYDYYRGNGFWCILLDRILHLVEIGFIAVFLTFLTQCVNYAQIPASKTMKQILVPRCTGEMSGTWNFALWVTAFYWVWKAFQIPLDLRRLSIMRDFFVHLLDIPEHDMQTVSWQDVVARIMELRDSNPKTADRQKPGQRKWLGSQSKERLDAHDIANRLMRRENFLIALINKDILDLSIPLPFLSGRQFLSRLLEWTLNFSIMDFVFDERGQVNQEFLKADRRGQLSQKLKARFLFAGIMTLMIAPFMAGYLFIMHFLTYFHEYHKNPSSLGTRAYTPLAEWKFREFNELPHIFYERVNMSYPFAKRYLDQFPSVVTERLARTVAFVAGALATVLAIATMVDPDLFLGFEITHDRTALFYLTAFAGVWAFARGMIPEDNTVFNPEYVLRQVIEYTHYEPEHWKGRLHSYEVKTEFSGLYKNKVIIFMEEIVSILIAPLILIVSLPRSSDQIVDFFREFTIHVDGLGYVCSFAVFDFKKVPKQPSTGGDVRGDYYSTKHGKMAASFYGFLDNYVINPKTGIPGHLPPNARHQFQPPPAFPGLQSPTLGADMTTSRMGHSQMGRPRSRAPGGSSQVGRTPNFGPVPPSLSPMASILLDPHHQPQVQALGKSVQRMRHGRKASGGHGEGILEEALEDGNENFETTQNEDDDVYESGHGLDQSEWQTAAPAHALGRDNSGVNEGEEEVGVLGLMYQFQREMKHR
ncbi:hypothetical protein M406DRAFT_65086 [Cryphonectria parasitica EP155]|uniref:Autophagy-related protein 9 n=1 Tax=Cryphonectria parasitica (strain ATCC 38755 / EP155) TaxID=660469 RepID=A0A9P4XZ93_CRYP1|nr:uncharacterized protein M406DRAFT_65086 [Cryphonectria parasitica EP155]KAF3763738.1 hypothetical protein M406DRAFT_65086 [Cryphonectria parasitica EP155]